jgi:hypothetical protein
MIQAPGLIIIGDKPTSILQASPGLVGKYWASLKVRKFTNYCCKKFYYTESRGL